MNLIKKRKQTKMTYYVYCPECDKEIKGSTAKQCEANLKQHIKTHGEKNEVRRK